MIRKMALVIALVLGLALVSPDSRAAILAQGQSALPFVVRSGDDQNLTLNMVLGKVVVLFYESRQVIDKNEELKDELKRLYRVQPENIQKEIFRLVVIDCSQASRPTVSIWKSNLAKHSQVEGFTIYGDWDRQMLKDYGLQQDDSNFLIIDKNGIIRYYATGKISNGQFQQIKNLLTSLVQEG